MSLRKICSGIVGFSLLAAAAVAAAQGVAPQGVEVQPDQERGSVGRSRVTPLLGRLRLDPSPQIFSVRVVNDSKITFYYKLVGGPGRPYYDHQTLVPAQSELEDATGGDKVLCIWTPSGTLLGAWRTVVNGSGKIVIADCDLPGHFDGSTAAIVARGGLEALAIAEFGPLRGATAAVLVESLVPPRSEVKPDVQPNLSSTTFKVRVVNGLKVNFYYKLVGGPGKQYVHKTLAPGEAELEDATGGEKVLCVWTPSGTLLGIWRTVVNGSGKIVIADLPGRLGGAGGA